MANMSNVLKYILFFVVTISVALIFMTSDTVLVSSVVSTNKTIPFTHVLCKKNIQKMWTYLNVLKIALIEIFTKTFQYYKENEKILRCMILRI